MPKMAYSLSQQFFEEARKIKETKFGGRKQKLRNIKKLFLF
jgi:hypothetical protein